ncbi:MAG: 50S ribosomal protein L23 [SAR202 cluster bacterium]|nr:50S ribosomal protein L23 [SAR202 cluster bacterium]
MNIYEVLLRPTFTEKSTLMQESGRYTFHIAPTANKTQVKEAVERNFNVTVVAVNITKLRGKRHRYGPRFKQTPDTKKAVVTLKPGDRINLIEGL